MRCGLLIPEIRMANFWGRTLGTGDTIKQRQKAPQTDKGDHNVKRKVT
jgi:hypothetical protein